MKNISFSLLAAALLFTACKKSTTEEPVGFQWPAGTSDYAPYTNGSTFTFETSSGTPVVIDSFTYTVAKDTPINGLTFRKLVSNKPALAATYFTNYNAGVTTDINYDFNLQGFTIPQLTQTVLKESVAVGGTWKDSINVSSVPVTLTYTLLQKDITKNILSKDYANSYAVKQVISIPPAIATLLGIPATVQIDNFYSKGVGRVQREGANGTVKVKRYNVIK
jgi:hypothetical protein